MVVCFVSIRRSSVAPKYLICSQALTKCVPKNCNQPQPLKPNQLWQVFPVCDVQRISDFAQRTAHDKRMEKRNEIRPPYIAKSQIRFVSLSLGRREFSGAVKDPRSRIAMRAALLVEEQSSLRLAPQEISLTRGAGSRRENPPAERSVIREHPILFARTVAFRS